MPTLDEKVDTLLTDVGQLKVDVGKLQTCLDEHKSGDSQIKMVLTYVVVPLISLIAAIVGIKAAFPGT